MVKQLAPAVFLDRDGVINEDSGYVDDPRRVALLKGSIEGIKLLREKGFKIVIVTNQSGVARGLFSEEQLQRINERVLELLANGGVKVDGLYYCPHHPDEGCECRKPKPGLITRAISELGLEVGTSFLIGDSLSDVKAGRVAGVKSVVLIDGPRYKREIEEGHTGSVAADTIADNLEQAAKWIVTKG